MGASYYVNTHHPPGMDDLTEDDIVDLIVGDITEGADGTGIRSGIIGEVGCAWPLADNERKSAEGIGARAANDPARRYSYIPARGRDGAT